MRGKQLTEWHRIGSTYLHVSTRKNSHAKAQRDADLFVLLFLCQKSLHTELKVAVRTCEGKANHKNTQKLCFACCSAKVCAVCVRQFHSAGYSCKLTSATFGSCPFVAQKNTSRYAQIRGDFSVYSVYSVWKNVSRKGAKGRGDLWAHRKHGRTQNF